jgi:hypothetical protein
MPLYKKAEAGFKYNVGGINDIIKVGAESSTGKNRDDWLIYLALQAGVSVSNERKTGIQAIALVYIEDSLNLTA